MTTGKARMRVCFAVELSDDRVIAMPLEKRKKHRSPRSLMVLRDQEGTIRGYMNECQHIPVPLDAGTGQFLTYDRRYLMCGLHGAIYQRHDGLCIAGPCAGETLEKVEVEEEAGVVYATVTVATEPDPDR